MVQPHYHYCSPPEKFCRPSARLPSGNGRAIGVDVTARCCNRTTAAAKRTAADKGVFFFIVVGGTSLTPNEGRSESCHTHSSAPPPPPRPRSAPIIFVGGHCCTKRSVNRRTQHCNCGGNGENKRAVKLCLPFRTLSQRLLSAVALPVRSDAHAKLVFPRALPLLRTRRRSPLPVRTATRARSPPPFLRPSVFNISPACAQNLSPTFLLWRVTSTDFRLVIKWILTKENDLTIYLGHLSTSV